MHKLDKLSELGAVNATVLSLIITPINDTDGVKIVLKTDDETHNALSSEEELRDSIGKMRHKPQIIILECAPIKQNTASRPEDEIVNIIASSLVESGICAVIFRQADMSDDGWNQFLLTFLTSLNTLGNIDRAHHQARIAIINKTDVWKAVLITRLRTGNIWYDPQFLDEQGDFWKDVLKGRILDGTCIPVIGPGISDYLIQSRAEVARRWADSCNYPMAPHQRGVLRKIAQYVGTSIEPAAVEKQFLEHVIDCAVDQYGRRGLPDRPNSKDLYKYMDEIWHEEISQYPEGQLGPYQLLAKMRAPIYFTTTFYSFLSVALSSEEKIEPRDRILSLERGMRNGDKDVEDTGLEIDRNHPLIYHLFGRLDQNQSHNNLILTEDQHFEFLVKFREYWNALPNSVIELFSESSLLFLGFRLDSWDFRTLFRAIQEFEGMNLLRKIPHVAVQIDPDDDRIKDPELTKKYLIAHFSQISIKPHIFLGSAHDFLKELHSKTGLDQLKP